jgi:SAM-dependent methyltransferase
VIRSIPRFVSSDNYAASFGLEWTIHSHTQYDRRSGVPLSERRFFQETHWPRQLDGEIIVEAGSGSGRLTEHAASTGATVLSLDYSDAVEANFAFNGARENVLIVQGDIFRMPFRRGYADRLFCFGVLQHTPDPRRAFLALPRHLKPRGYLVTDVYAKSFAKYWLGTKYWVRPLTRRIPPERLYRYTSRYIDLMWPVARWIRRIPKLGKPLNWRLLIADYSDVISDDETLKEWARLDTFDMLAPRYDAPQRLATVKRWCAEAGLVDVDVGYGHDVIEIRARQPLGPSLDVDDRKTR